VLAAGATAVALTAAALVGHLPRLATDVTVPPLTVGLAAHAGPPPTAVPDNVAPPLRLAVDDNPEIYADGCHGDFEAVTPGDCVFGTEDGPRSMLLAGDSHAAQWFPALDRLATEDGWRLVSLTKSACPTVDFVVQSRALGRDYRECREWLDAVVERARAERPDVVLLSNWGASYVREMGKGGLRRWVDGLHGFIGRLPRGTDVVLLGDTPTWQRPPAECLSENLRSPRSCSRPVGALVDERVQSAEATLAQGTTTFVVTYPWLCDAECHALNRNVVVYRDEHHLTATMSRLLVQRMRAAVPAVGRSPA
jgi:hypothetical protein